MITIFIILAVVISAIYLLLQQKTFGKNPDGECINRIEKSPNYKNGRFQNLSPTEEVLKDASYLYLGGDSGYETHFSQIGKSHGPFDLAILDCGQYGKDRPYIHMMPEQTALAAKEWNAKVLFPVHWAKFALLLHARNEPINRL